MLTEYKPNRPLRSLGSSQLEIPRIHTKQGESTFSYYATRSWNQLPEEIRCRDVSINHEPVENWFKYVTFQIGWDTKQIVIQLMVYEYMFEGNLLSLEKFRWYFSFSSCHCIMHSS